MTDEKSLVVMGKLNNTPNGVVRAINRSENTRPVSFITEAEVNAVVDVAGAMRDGERNQLMILMMFQCALRVSEVIQLCPNKRQVIEGKPILAVIGKGNKPRLVPIPERLSHHLGDYASRKGITGDMRYFPITRFRALQIIKECAAKAGISRRTYCHLLRHSGALARLAKTGHPRSLQVYLGHSDIKMTMGYLSTLQAIDSLNIESKVEFER